MQRGPSRVSAVVLLTLTACMSAAPESSPPTAAVPVPTTECPAFPAENWWHADVSDLPVHERSDEWLSHMSTDADLHPDFGPTMRYGIPVTVVDGDHRKVRVRFRYADESDRVRYPLGRDTLIEGGRGSDGDRHAIVVDRDSCVLYETWLTRKVDGRWRAGSGAVWDLTSNELRPEGWTSADAAGLPVLPGLLTWQEVRDDAIDHAIRFTTDVTSEAFLWPARHEAGDPRQPGAPPMGARFRLDPEYDASELSAEAQRVVEAMQTYGLVLADNGSPWFFQGESSRAWPEQLVSDLKEIPASAFEAVDTSCLMPAGGEDSAAVDPAGCP